MGEYNGVTMNKQAEIIEDDNEEFDTELDVSAEHEEVDTDEVDANDDAEQGEDEQVVIEIEGESPPPEDDAKAPGWVKDLRKSNREKERENRKLREQLAKLSSAAEPTAVELGKKPTIEGADYDSAVYERQLIDWVEKKRAVEERQKSIEAERQKEQEAWNATLETYGQNRKSLKVKDFEEAELVVQDELSNTQQGMILQGADNPALLIYALGKNPKKAKEIASIKDPVKFAFAVAKLETQLKVKNRKAAAAPERVIQGSARSSGAVDSTLERLREEAARTGNMDKVMQYKRQQKNK
jgi:hypothetical protein